MRCNGRYGFLMFEENTKHRLIARWTEPTRHRIMNTIRLFIILTTTLLFPFTSLAEIRIDGYLIAKEDCEALVSIRKHTNPDNIRLTINGVYEVISQNKADATHYRIRVDTARPPERWVAVACGNLLPGDPQATLSTPSESVGSQGRANDSPVASSAPSTAPSYLLALSWQPAFCQTHPMPATSHCTASGRNPKIGSTATSITD